MPRNFQNPRRAFHRCSRATHGVLCPPSHSSVLIRLGQPIAPTTERQKRVGSTNILLWKRVGWAPVTLGGISYAVRNFVWCVDERCLKDLSDSAGVLLKTPTP